MLIARSLACLGILAHLSVSTHLGAPEEAPDAPAVEAEAPDEADLEPPEAGDEPAPIDEAPSEAATPSIQVLDGGTGEPETEPAAETAPAPAPAVAPAAPPKCRKHEDCAPDMACHITRKMCLAPAIVVSDTKRETVKLAVASPIAIIMGGGLTGLGVWLLTEAKDKNRQAAATNDSKQKEDLKGEANVRTALGAASVAIGGMAALGGLIGLAFVPVYVNRKRGAQKRMELSLFGSPMGAAGVRGRF